MVKVENENSAKTYCDISLQQTILACGCLLEFVKQTSKAYWMGRNKMSAEGGIQSHRFA
jgi:hypothetical protein